VVVRLVGCELNNLDVSNHCFHLGTAGLALAARLSQTGKYTVGVLEAGGSGLDESVIDIPGKFGADLGTVYDCMCQCGSTCFISYTLRRELYHNSRFWWQFKSSEYSLATRKGQYKWMQRLSV
jgi:choline dehydrogenase-like flavoprotein